MDARAGTLTLDQGRRRPALPWLIVAVEGLIILTLAIALLVARPGGGAPSAAPRPDRVASFTQLAHDLAAVGYTTSGMVTGTGPGLVEIGSRQAPAVTGTGPGLIRIADQH